MLRFFEVILLLFADWLALCVTFVLWAFIRIHFGFFAIADISALIVLSTTLFGFWAFLFALGGMYKTVRGVQLTSEMTEMTKLTALGTLIIFVVTIDPIRDLSDPLPLSRVFILVYFLIAIVLLIFGRLAVVKFIALLLSKGLGRIPAVIAGNDREAHWIAREIARRRDLGLELIGFCNDGKTDGDPGEPDAPLLGELSELKQILTSHQVRGLIIVLSRDRRQLAQKLIELCHPRVRCLLLLPDLIDSLSGRVRRRRLAGLPLERIFASPMTPGQSFVKRLFDLAVSLALSALLLPLWVFVFLLEKFRRGVQPLAKHRFAGRHRQPFSGFMFAVETQKPSPAGSAAESRLRTMMRRYGLYRSPLLLNVILGDLSLTGPSLDRFENESEQEAHIKEFDRRFWVKPGLIGWAQLEMQDGETRTAIRRLRYDVEYVDNFSLILDIKIMWYWIRSCFKKVGTGEDQEQVTEDENGESE